MRPFVFLLTLWDVVFVISRLYFKYFVQPLACYKGKENPLRNPFLKNTTLASKKFAIFVWINSNYNAVIFSDKKSENFDSHKH